MDKEPNGATEGRPPAITTLLNGHRPEGRRVAGTAQAVSSNLADLLERVLDKGIIIAGDITLCLGEIELLQIKVRLLIASVDKARDMGIDWWQHDPALSSAARRQVEDRDELMARLDRLEKMLAAVSHEREAAPPLPRLDPVMNGHAAGRLNGNGAHNGSHDGTHT